MASTRINSPLRGWLQHLPLFDPEHLSTTDSTYTQAGPTAGGLATPAAPSGSSAPVRAEIDSTGDQDASVVVECLQGGNPGVGQAMRIGYRLASEASTAVRGWEPPNVLTGSSSPIYGTTVWDSLDAVVLRNGKLLIGMRDSGASSLSLYEYDPTTATWSAATAPTTSTSISKGFALAVDSEGYIYAFVHALGTFMYRTKSPDTTADGWTSTKATVSGATGTNSDKMRLVLHPTGDWSLWSFVNGAPMTVSQWASSDGGSSWTLIASDTTTYEFAGDVVLMPSGRVGLAVIDGTTAFWYSTGSPYQSVFTASDAVQIATTSGEIWACLSPEGRIWAVRRDSGTGDLSTLYSDDSGDNWTEMASPITNASDTGQIATAGRMVCMLGTFYLAHQASDSVGSNDASPVLTRLGGWANVVFGPILGAAGGVDTSFGSGTNSSAQAATWFPVSEPDDLTCWTAAGTGGDPADLMTSAGRLQISTSASSRYFDMTTAPTTARTAAHALAHFRVTTLGSTSLFRCGFSVRLSDGANASELQVWASTTQFVVRDHTSALATVTIDMSADMQFRVYLERAGYAAVYYRRPYQTTWTLAYETTTMATTASATTWFRWGHFTASTSVSEWSTFWAVAKSNALLPCSRLANASYQGEPAAGHLLSGLWMPLGEGAVGTANQRVLYIRGKDGPGYNGETYTIAPRYAFPIEAIFPTVDPSPRTTWRSTSTAENAIGITIDDTYTTSISRNIGLALFGVNFPTAYLEAHNGAGWDSIGTWSGIIGSSLSFTRTGNVIRINGGTALGRYIHRGELVGATVDLGSSKYRRIARHTEGIWSTASGKHVELVLEGVDGTEPASGSSMAIWARSGVLVVHALSSLYRRWRLRIPSGSTADGYFEIGTLVLGPLLAFGRQHSWTWTSVSEPNALKTTTRDLVSRVRRLGPARRTWTWSWTELLPQHGLRDATPTPNYLAHTATSEGIANWLDVPWLLQGALEELKSGEVPVVALPTIGDTGAMVTDPTQFLLGRVDSSIGFENERGDESTGEAGRVSPVALVEIV